MHIRELKQVALNVKGLFILTIVTIFSVLSILFTLIILNFYKPVSYTLNSSLGIMGVLYEFLPLAFMICILFLFKINKIKTEKAKHFGIIEIGIILGLVVFCIIVLFRIVDVSMMVMFATYSHDVWLAFSNVSFRILFYNLLSLILIITIALFFNKNGLKTFFSVLIIPAFYSLNADLILTASKIPALSFFYPVYQFILEFGRMETQVITSLLNLLNFNAVCNTLSFPYTLLMGNQFYLIDLPCIGWEGIMGYSIIFVNLVLDFEISNKMKLIWSVLGLIGTMFANFFRLALIFILGDLFGVETALLVHQHGGDIIFLIWIFAFIFIINKFKDVKFGRIFGRLKSRLSRS